MSVQKFYGTIETDGIKDGRGIETPSLTATGEVSGQTGVFSESVTAPNLSGNLTGNVTGDVTGDITGTAAKATADAQGNVIPTTYATKEELAEETSARETAETNLSKGITDEATARAAAIEDIIDGTTVVGKATADGNGNNIASTYATQSALSSGLAGKANTSGTYPNMTVGNATNATNATNDGSGHPILSFLKTSLSIDDLSSSADLPTQANFSFIVNGVVSSTGACAAANARTAENDVYSSSNITANIVNGYTIKVMFTDTMGVQLSTAATPSVSAKVIVSAIGGFPLSGTEFALTALSIR